MTDYEDEDEVLIETKPIDFDFVKEDGEVATCCMTRKKKEGIAVKISLNQMKRLQQDFSFRLQGREDVEA